MSSEAAALQEVATRLAASTRAVAFTGAGISTESGIPDFRSPGGVWSRHRPVMYQEFLASHDARRRYWAMKKEAFRDFADAAPNVAHRVLARWESSGRLRGVITQNIDGLHQDAGSSNVLELHGTNREVYCLDCGQRYPAAQVQEWLEAGEDVPACRACSGWLKPATVSFGQNLPVDVLEAAQRLSEEADCFIAIGSSLVVQPAAGLPELAKRRGAYLVIVNRDETPLDPFADRVIRTSAGAALEAIDAAFGAR